MIITLAAVTAVATTDVWAVGSAGRGLSAERPVIEHWDGRHWRVVAGPVEPTPSRFAAVAGAAGNVWAVGSLLEPGGVVTPLVVHWDGTRWRPQVLPAAVTGDLYGVAALSPRDVWAVGTTNADSTGQPLILHWDGAAWTAWPAPVLYAGNATLYGVAAVSAHDVWAVGKNGDDPIFEAVPLVEHWNGTSWHLASGVNPDASLLADDRLYAVAALSSDDVWAVGAIGGARQADTTLVEHWNGKSWTIMLSPNPEIYSNVFLQVAAIAPRDVWLVEHNPDPTEDDTTYTVHWDGARWAVVPAPGLRALGVVAGGGIWGVGTRIVQYHGPLCTADPIVATVSLGPLPQEAVNAVIATVLPAASHVAVDIQTNRVFVASDPGTVSILDAGASSPAQALLRTVHLPITAQAGSLLRALAVDQRTDRVFIADSSASVVYVLDAATGTFLHTITVGVDPRAIAVDAGQGEVFVVNGNRNETTAQNLGNGSVSVLDASTGRVLAMLATGENPVETAVDARSGRLFVADDEGIRMFDVTQRAQPARLVATLAITDVAGLVADEGTGHLFVAYYVGDETSVAMVDAVRGTNLVRTLPGSAASSRFCCPFCGCFALDPQTRRLFVATSPGGGGQLSVVDTATGRIVNTLTLPSGPRALAVDERQGHVFVAALTQTDYMGGTPIGPGSVSVLDARDGTLLNAIPVGFAPYTLTVDARTSRAFVLTLGPCCPSSSMVTILHTDPPPVTVLP
jgi:YVTN family beta-propeller protein